MLGGNQLHRLPLGNAGVDHQLLSGLGGDTHRLEGADSLGVGGGVTGLDLVHHSAQAGGIPLQEGLCQIQLVQKDGLVDIVAVRLLDAGPQLVDASLCDPGGQLGVAAVGKEGGDAAIRVVVGVEGDFRKGAGLAGAVPLTHQDGDLLDVVVAGEGQDGVARLSGVVPDDGGGPHILVGEVVQHPLVAGKVGLVAVLIPDGDGVALQDIGVALVEAGNINEVVHALFLVKLKGEPAAEGPLQGGPVGLEVPIVDLLYVELAAILRGDVVGVCHFRLNDGGAGDAVHGGQGGEVQNLLFRLAGGDEGGTAEADLIPCYHVEIVEDVVGEAGDGKGGSGVFFHRQDEVLGGGFFIVEVIEFRVLGLLPAGGDGAFLRGEGEVIRRERRFGGLGNAADRGGILPGPVAVVGGDGEVVGLQVLQAADDGLGLPHPQLAGEGGAGFAVAHQIAVHVIHPPPGEGHLVVPRGGGEVFGDGGAEIQVIGDDIPQKLNLLDDGVAYPAISAEDLFHRDGDFLHRLPLTQGDGDGALPQVPLGGVGAGGRGVIKGDLLGGAVFVFHQNLPRLQSAVGGGGDDGKHAHFLWGGKGDRNLAGAVPAVYKADLGTVIFKKVVDRAPFQGHLRLGKVLGGGRQVQKTVGDQGAAIDLRRPAGAHVAVDQGQVGDIHLSVQVQVAASGAAPQGGQHLVQVRLGNLPVPGEIP